MNKTAYLPRAILIIFALLFATSDAQAQFDRRSPNAVIRVGQNFSGGRGWQTMLPDIGVNSITVTVRRTSGSDKTFVNLRYGEHGQTFDNGKREYLRDNEQHTLVWSPNGESPRGRPLVLNVYDGTVYVESVQVAYANQAQQQPPRPNPRPNNGGYNQGGYDDDAHGYGNDDYDYGNQGQNNPSFDQQGGNNEVYRRCRNSRDNRRPRIEIGRIRPSGGLFSGKYKIDGSIFASCVQEAGYFEEGRLKEKLPFPMDDRFNRREFSLQVRSGRGGEIRAYTINGGEEFLSVDEAISRSGAGGSGGGQNNNPLGNFGF